MGLNFCYDTDELLYEDEEEGKVYKHVTSKVKFGYIHFEMYRRELFGTFDDRNLNQMYGFCPEHFCNDLCETCKIFHKLHNWDTVFNNLKYLIHHSDTEGLLTVDELKLIIPELKKVTSQISEVFFEKHVSLIKFMEECVGENKELIFC